MGTYIYGLRKNTIKHPVHGEVGVLYFLHKPASWKDPRGERTDAMREGRVRSLWKRRTIPKVVVMDSDPTVFYAYAGGCLWNDFYTNVRTPLPPVVTAIN